MAFDFNMAEASVMFRNALIRRGVTQGLAWIAVLAQGYSVMTSFTQLSNTPDVESFVRLVDMMPENAAGARPMMLFASIKKFRAMCIWMIERQRFGLSNACMDWAMFVCVLLRGKEFNHDNS